MSRRPRVEAVFFVFVLCFSWRTTSSRPNANDDQNSTEPTSTVSPSQTPSPKNTTQRPSPGNRGNFSHCFEGGRNESGCMRCIQGYTGKWCEECVNGWHGNLTDPRDACKPCNCSGNLDPHERHSCHPVTGACQKCLPNTSGLHCEKCADGYHGDAVGAKGCTSDVKRKIHHKTKDLVIVVVCSILGAICIIAIGMILYQVRKRHCRKEKGTFWKVELSNRNYDNLDFSLLDPVTDTPLVFRADIAGFDEDALLGSEKPQLILETEDSIID